MFETVHEFLQTVLLSLYVIFFPSAVLTILGMFVYMYGKEKGWKTIINKWIENFRENRHFRIVLGFVFYTAMIAEKTLLGRSIWKKPMGDLMGFFWLYENKIPRLVENIQNLLLFAPYMIFVFYLFGDRIFKNRKRTLGLILFKAMIISFAMSMGIELCQLFFKLGNVQLSDICANTLSGVIGGFIYWIIEKIRNRKKDLKEGSTNEI